MYEIFWCGDGCFYYDFVFHNYFLMYPDFVGIGFKQQIGQFKFISYGRNR